MKKKLPSKTTDFLRLVSQAVFTNPFSKDRAEIDARISGISGNVSAENRIDAAIKRVKDVLNDIKGSGATNLNAENKELLRYAILFDIYHRYIDRFDDLIRNQTNDTNAKRTVPFAAKCIEDLAEGGFNKSESLKYFALFYQIRRAFFFVSSSLAGEDSYMIELKSSLWQNVFTSDMRLYQDLMWNRMEDFSTMLLGETGTGKGAAAAAIGKSGFLPFNDTSMCFEENFINSFTSINLSEYPETLIESELFGHRKGAFTGAVEEHKGILSRCSGHGSIFLDEIGDVSIPIQTKLLRVLQERVYYPVGSHQPSRFKGRVIAATNKSIEKLRSEELFREDFFYRLCSDVIKVPALRDRLREKPDELNTLTELSLQRILGSAPAGMTELTVERIIKSVGTHYSWPGNVRELEQCIRRILITGCYKPQTRTDEPESQLIHRKTEEGTCTAKELTSLYCAMLYERLESYEKVALTTGLDRRTVKKYVQMNSY